MNKENILKNANIIDTVLQMPQVFIEQFIKISAYYLAYINIDDPSNKDRTDYINESYNAMTLLNKLIATASNGGKIEYQIRVPEEERLINDEEIEKQEKESEEYFEEIPSEEDDELESMYVDDLFDGASQSSYNNTEEGYEEDDYDDDEYVIDGNKNTNEMENLDILIDEMHNWGIKESSFAYKCVMAMYHCCSFFDSPERVINKLAVYMDKPVGTISNAFNYIIKNANFENTDHCIKLKDKQRWLISREELISELEYYVR